MKKIIFPLIVVFLLNTLISYSAQCATPMDCTFEELDDPNIMLLAWNPVADLSEDSSYYGRRGTTDGDVFLNSTAKVVGDYSGTFVDDNNPVTYGTDEYFATMQSFTICAWTNYQDNNQYQTIASMYSSAGQNENVWTLNIRGDADVVKMYHEYDGNVEWGGTSFLNTNHFEYLCGQVNYTGGKAYLYLYINGTVVAENSHTMNPATTNDDLIIGDQENQAYELIAEVDALILLNASISGTDIREHLWNNGDGVEPPYATPDITPPITNATFNNTSPKYGDIINLSANLSDETALQTINYTINFSTGLIKNNYSITGTDLQFSNSTQFNEIKGNVINVTFYAEDSSGNTKQNSTLITTTNTEVLAPTGIAWKTTGGLTSGTRTYNEILDWVNATCIADIDGDFSSCNITITDPASDIRLNNNTMDLVQNDVYSYSTDIILDKAGVWTITISSTDNESVSTASTTITVQTQNLSTTDGWYGYTEEGIFTTSEIGSLIDYDYTLLELRINATRIQDDWVSLLEAINYSNDKNIRIGLNVLMNFNYSVHKEKVDFYNNISANFSDLNEDPYEDTIEYISLEINNITEYSDIDKYNVLNNASQNITEITGNRFVIYSKNYPSENLDTSYIQNTTMKYLTPKTHDEWILVENQLMRNTSSLNRIYTGINGSLKTDVASFWVTIIEDLRGKPDPTTTVGNQTVAEIDNGDFIVFNNKNIGLAYFLNFSNVSDGGVIGKDIWDYTNKIYVHSNTNGTGNINVSAYSVTMIFAEDFDHIEGTFILYKATSSGEEAFNYTDDGNDGNFALDNDADEIKIELFDPHYNINSFITYYGWFNVSYISNWSVYDIVIFDDENDDVVEPVINNATNTDFYCYISVADYANTEAWQSGKETEVDNCIALYPSSNNIQVFLDGLDTGVGGTNFSTRFKELSNYVKITKGRKLGLNTYTAYEDFCTYSAPDGFCMKESCVRRWNGVNSQSPDSYTFEDWGLEMNKSLWYQSHNVRVLCQAFDNRTQDTFEMYNWSIVQNVYFASKVLGYDDFYISQPDFNYAHTEYLYDVGTDLAQSFSTEDNETYYRRYSEGIVYYNTSTNKGWIDDGRETDVQICFKLYDGSDGAGDEERDFEFRVNNVTTTDDHQYMIDAEDITAGVWDWYCVKLNETHESPHGSYKIEASTTNGGQVADGIYTGWASVDGTGKHSWYSTIAGSPVWTVYAKDQNWEVKVVVNETKKASVDTFTEGITQTETTALGKTNITLAGNKPFDIEIWSEPTTISKFLNLSYWDGAEFHRIYPINTSTCSSSHPDWNSTTVGSEVHKSCVETIDDTTIVRVASPHLSTQLYQVDFNTLPTVNIVQPQDNTLYNLQPFHINYTFTDIDGDTITQVKIYINDTLNQTILGNTNTTLNASDGKYNISVSAYDGFDWGPNSTTSSFKIDTVNPVDNLLVTILDGTYIKQNTNYTVQASDLNLFGHNVTVYASNESIVFSIENLSITNTTNDILVQLNISWDDGNYTIFSNESDDHTAKLIDKIKEDKDKDNKKIVFEDEIEISDITAEKLDDLKTEKKDDRISFIFDYSKSKQKEDGKKNTYIFSIKTKTLKLHYRSFSNYYAHFVVGRGIGEYWIDYEFKNNKDAEYIITRINDYEYHIMIITEETYLDFSSIGGVNKGGAMTHIVIDTTTPTFYQAMNRTTSSNSSIIYDNTDVTLSVWDVKDLHLKDGNFSENVTGTWVNHSSFENGNGTYNIIIQSENLTVGQVVGWKFYAYDKVGNELDPLYTFVVQQGVSTSPPVSVGGGGAELFASQSASMSKELCESSAGMVWYKDMCYQCDGKIIERDNQILCLSCNEGFILVGEECVAEITPKDNTTFFDRLLYKYFPTNPLLGFIIVLSGGLLAIHVLKDRKVIVRRFKK